MRCSGWRSSCLELTFEQQPEKPSPALHTVAPEVLDTCELQEQGLQAGSGFAQCSHKAENCWSRQIPHLFQLEFLVSDLPHHKPNMLGILMELLVWLSSPACCLPGQCDTLLHLSSRKRSSLSALEHEQMLGALQFCMLPPQYVTEHNFSISSASGCSPCTFLLARLPFLA